MTHKKHKAHKTKHPHKVHVHKKHKAKKPNYVLLGIAAVAVIIIIIAVLKLPELKPVPKSLSKCEGDDVIAKVNGVSVKCSNYKATLSRLPPQQQALYPVGAILNITIIEALLKDKAIKSGIEVTDAEVDNLIQYGILRAGMTQEQFEQQLALSNLTVDMIKEMYRNQLVITKYLNKTVLATIRVTDEELSAEYGNNAKARHILVNTQEDAEAIIEELQGGADFEELAKERSIGPSAAVGGDLGVFSRGTMVQEFEDAVFALEEGEISGVVQTQFGYHVIKREAMPPLEESREELRMTIANKKSTTAVSEYIAGLMEESEIKILVEIP